MSMAACGLIWAVFKCIIYICVCVCQVYNKDHHNNNFPNKLRINFIV